MTRPDREVYVPLEANVRADQFDEIQRRVLRDGDDRDAVVRSLLDLGIARAREIEQDAENDKAAPES